ncbi:MULTISPECIES: DUF4190 domain-containing protein [Streptomyces]|uniref:DUF4190 domain-containing protein n=1 Tax=Streptomyces TaxID=1883 RepID=UPI0009909C58|nr:MULTISPECIES: DUF4190 domain-containing protein [unclassified Streptomyces]AQT75588.1 hypothetical protein B1K54_31725 [Streptomyces sp. fd1-xmd]MDX6762093.1 septum formation family protein [Streptomyces sp. F8]
MSIPPGPPPSHEPYPQQGPYGRPGQPAPYGGPPQGWYAPPAPQKNNALAIVAFVMSLVCAIPLVPLILGIVALSQIRKRGEKGKGFAVAAIAIHGATIAFYGILLVLGLSGALDDGPSPKRDTSGQVTGSGSVKVSDIRKGDCFNTNGDLAEYQDEDGGEASFSVRVVPCDQPHEGEAYAVFNLDNGTYPGTEKVTAMAEEKCAGTLLTDYVGKDPKLAEKLEVYYYFPQAATWALGDREVTCFLGDTSGASTGSARATGS